MIELFTQAAEIVKCHRQLKSRLARFASKRFTILIGFQGGNVNARVNYSESLDIWWLSQDFGRSFWNPFGVGVPSTKHGNSIVCEINYAKSGRLTTHSAAFGMDESGDMVLLHSGRIGGGRIGVGRSLFFDKFVGEILDVRLPDGARKYATVGALEAQRFPQQVALFVKEVARIKKFAKAPGGNPVLSSIRRSFTAEVAGTKRYRHKRNVAAHCDHGLVVNALMRLLERRGYNTANDVNRDLYTLTNGKKIRTVFEIKTDSDTQSLYTAVGQLLLNNLHLPHKPKLFLVLPSRISATADLVLRELGIECLVYGWKDERPVFKYTRKL